jgi:hypothetical protein
MELELCCCCECEPWFGVQTGALGLSVLAAILGAIRGSG